VNALREGDKETPRNMRRLFSERIAYVLRGDMVTALSDKDPKHVQMNKKENVIVGFAEGITDSR
jgi:hypothetical protein